MKLKLKEQPAAPARKKKVGDVIVGATRSGKPERVTHVVTGRAPKKKPGMEDESLDAKVAEPPVRLVKRTFEIPDDGRVPRLALLNKRHDDWLQAAAAQERRTPEQFLDRLVRLAWAKDSSKGGKFSDALGGDGHGRGRAPNGYTGSHPASGNE